MQGSKVQGSINFRDIDSEIDNKENQSELSIISEIRVEIYR